MSFAFVFPGQGSQSVGMLAELAAQDPVVRATFEEASGALGYDLWKLTQEGPKERLDTTECTQPAMLAAGVATWRLWRQRGGGEPSVVSGHSLGEFTALVCAGALEFPAAVDLVRFRGQVMQEAVPAGRGAMAAILGLEDTDVEAACREASEAGVVQAANFNSPGQVVIAGERAAVEQAIGIAKAKGAKRAVALPVSVPSHSSLMREAGRRLGERLAGMRISVPRIRYISAVDVATHEQPDDLRQHLTRQLSSPVLWTATVQALAASGIAQLIECGPGKVLTALNRRIERGTSGNLALPESRQHPEHRPGLECLALEDAASLDAALAATRAQQGSGHA